LQFSTTREIYAISGSQTSMDLQYVQNLKKLLVPNQWLSDCQIVCCFWHICRACLCLLCVIIFLRWKI